MLLRRLRLWAGLLLILTCPEAVAAQGVVRLSSTEVTQTFSADGDTALLANTAFYASLRLDIDGSMTGTVTVSCSVNGSTYDAIPLNGPSPAVTADTDGAVTVPGQYTATIAGCSKVKAVASGWSAGTPSVTLRATSSGGSSGGSSSGGGGGGTTTDPDDASIAVSQTNDNVNALTNVYDGSVWRRLTIGTAGTASAQVLTVQGIASGTNLNVTCSNCSGTGVSVNEDVASANADPGTPAYTVRNNTLTAATGTDGDYQPVKSSAAGATYIAPTFADVVASTGTGASGAQTQRVVTATDSTIGTVTAVTTLTQLGGIALPIEDAAETDGGVGIYAMAVRRDTAASSSGTTGDNTPLSVDATGRLWVIQAATGVEDVAETPGGGLQMAGAVRRDTAASSAGTTGDNATLNTDAVGKLWITGSAPEDAAHTSADTGNIILSKRTDAAAVSSGTDGDYSTVNVDALGKLWVTGTYDEDAAHASGDHGLFIMAVRNDAGTALAGTTGDYIPLSTDSSGALRVVGSSGTTQFAEDIAHTTGDATVFISGIRRDTTPSSSAGTAGDYTAFNIDANGRVYTNTTLYNSSGTELTGGVDYTHDSALTVATTAGPAVVWRASTAAPSAVSADDDAVIGWADRLGRPHVVTEGIEDVAETAAGFLNMEGTVRRDTAASSAGTTGDNATLNTDAVGKLWVSGAFAEDAAHSSGDIGIFTLGRRIDTLAASSGTSGDYEALNMNALGAVWVSQLDPCSSEVKITDPFSLTARGVVIAAAASKKNYVCAISVVAGAAEIFNVYEGTGTTCQTGTAAIVGSTTAANGMSFAANGGLAAIGANSSVLAGKTANVDTCIVPSGSNRLSGFITYVQR